MSSSSGRQQGVADRTPPPERRPGAWPVAQPVDLTARQAEECHDRRSYARFHVTLGSVRADLEEQPSRRAVRSAARRWCTAITHLADEVENAKAKEAKQ